MPTTQNQKNATVMLKPHPNNMSAVLLRFLPMPRLAHKVATRIGLVRFDADLRTGKGIVMKNPYTRADLTSADRARIAAWLTSVKSASSTKRRAITSTGVKPL